VGWWTDIAVSDPGTPNHGGAATEQRGVVVHIAEGTYEGTIGWCKNPDSDVSCHFVVANDGRCTQMLDTDIACWAQRDGNGKWIAIENEGTSDYYLTPQQVQKNAEIFFKYCTVYGIACQEADSPDGWGLGHHSMGAENGDDWGHSECPGELIKSQKPGIVSQALAMGESTPPPMPGDSAVVVSDASIIKIAQTTWTQWLGGNQANAGSAGDLQLLAAENRTMLEVLTASGSGTGYERRVLRLLIQILNAVHQDAKPRPRPRARIPRSW
jgi:hypothetical protein